MIFPSMPQPIMGVILVWLCGVFYIINTQTKNGHVPASLGGVVCTVLLFAFYVITSFVHGDFEADEKFRTTWQWDHRLSPNFANAVLLAPPLTLAFLLLTHPTPAKNGGFPSSFLGAQEGKKQPIVAVMACLVGQFFVIGLAWNTWDLMWGAIWVSALVVVWACFAFLKSTNLNQDLINAVLFAVLLIAEVGVSVPLIKEHIADLAFLLH